MITDPIRAEHRALEPHIESLREAGDHVGEVASDVSAKEVQAILEFLHSHLIPHAEKEDRSLYPVVGGLLGSTAATRTMSRDHKEILQLTRQLERAAEEPDPRPVRRLLYGLYHLVKLHFAKEEEIYLPLLDERLSQREAEELYREMEEG